jgi:hypothetical protein
MYCLCTTTMQMKSLWCHYIITCNFFFWSIFFCLTQGGDAGASLKGERAAFGQWLLSQLAKIPEEEWENFTDEQWPLIRRYTKTRSDSAGSIGSYGSSTTQSQAFVGRQDQWAAPTAQLQPIQQPTPWPPVQQQQQQPQHQQQQWIQPKLPQWGPSLTPPPLSQYPHQQQIVRTPSGCRSFTELQAPVRPQVTPVRPSVTSPTTSAVVCSGQVETTSPNLSPGLFADLLPPSSRSASSKDTAGPRISTTDWPSSSGADNTSLTQFLNTPAPPAEEDGDGSG